MSDAARTGDSRGSDGRGPEAVDAVGRRRAAQGRLARLLAQFGRFLVVGGVAFAIDYGVFLVLHATGVPYVLSSAVSLTLSLVVSYVLTVHFVFEARPGRNVLLEVAIYVAISVVAIGINQGVLLVSVELAGLAPEVGKLVATAVVLVFNFVSRKLLIERRARPSAEPRERARP